MRVALVAMVARFQAGGQGKQLVGLKLLALAIDGDVSRKCRGGQAGGHNSGKHQACNSFSIHSNLLAWIPA